MDVLWIRLPAPDVEQERVKHSAKNKQGLKSTLSLALQVLSACQCTKNTRSAISLLFWCLTYRKISNIFVKYITLKARLTSVNLNTYIYTVQLVQLKFRLYAVLKIHSFKFTVKWKWSNEISLVHSIDWMIFIVQT